MKLMKLSSIICLLLALTNFSFSQSDVKKMTIKNDKLNIVESFYILNSNPEIRHGDYEKYQDYKLIEKGTYIYGEKQVWTYYDLKSHPVITYDFSKDSLISDVYSLRQFEIYSENKEKIFVEQPALALVADSEIYKYIARHIQYPEKARSRLIQGTVKIGIQIDDTGKVINYEVIQKIHPLLDEEALNVIKSFPSEWKWLPSVNKGKKIVSYYVIPIKFTIS